MENRIPLFCHSCGYQPHHHHHLGWFLSSVFLPIYCPNSEACPLNSELPNQPLELIISVHYLSLQEAYQASSHLLSLQPSSRVWLWVLSHSGHLLSLVPVYPEVGGVIFVKAGGLPLNLEPLVDTIVGHKPSAPWSLLTTLLQWTLGPGPGKSGQEQQRLRALPLTPGQISEVNTNFLFIED